MPNVTNTQFAAYLRTFHNALRETAERRLTPEHRGRLRNLGYLPARIIGYVSTQHGVAFEYQRAKATTIEVILGSARCEELLFGAPRRVSHGPAMMVMRNCSSVYVGGLSLIGAFPIRLEGRSDLTIEDVAFGAGSWSREVQYAELYTDRRAELWSEAQAIDRAKEEVIAALVDINAATKRAVSLDEYVAGVKQKTVLLLGDYGAAGRVRLGALKQALTQLGYQPMIVEDVPDDPHLDLSQKVVLLGSMARFVVMDDSSPSGHLTEFALCRDNRWITIILRADGRGGSAMTAGASAQSTVIRELSYDPASPLDVLPDSIKWAEARLQELKKAYQLVYPWRVSRIDHS